MQHWRWHGYWPGCESNPRPVYRRLPAGDRNRCHVSRQRAIKLGQCSRTSPRSLARGAMQRERDRGMAFTEIEQQAVERALAAFLRRRRPPPEIRSELDIQYRIKGQSVEIYELRPDWREPDRSLEMANARLTYVRNHGIWKIYWMRRDRRWHRYEPAPQAETIEQALQVVNEDRYCCFFG